MVMERVELQEAVNSGMTLRSLAAHFGYTSTGPVSYWLNKYNISLSVSRQGSEIYYVYSSELLMDAVKNSTSISGVARYLGSGVNSSSIQHIGNRIRKLEIDTSHFLKGGGGRSSNQRKSSSEILVVLDPNSIRIHRRLLHRALQDIGVTYKCVECGNIGEWLGKSLTLEIDHIDGDWRNNLEANLRYLCPNCHAVQETSR
jgi:hypothetical protein